MPEEKQITESAAQPAVKDKRIPPEGVVPRQAQGYVIAGLTLLILLAVMFSKSRPRPATGGPIPATQQAVTATDANARRIEELKENLNAEQRQSQIQAQSQKPGVDSGGPAGVNGGQAAPGPTAQPATAEAPRDPIADAERELVFKARFASNLVAGAAPSATSSTAADAGAPAPAEDASPTSRAGSATTQSGATQTASAAKRAAKVNLNSAHGQPYVLFEGTTIDTVLTNRLNGEFAGPVKVMVSNPVYSHDRQHVLIPEGTFLLGNVQKVSGFGQKRLAVTFHRMLMPDGYSADLEQFHGLDAVGDTGLKDKVNNHYMEIFGASIALGIIAGAAESTTNSGYKQSGLDAYRQGVASSMSQSSANVLDKFINQLPTITIREGHRIKVYLTQDMLLPAYENHSMPGVF